MTWRNGHGKGKGQPRIEVAPADELPKGCPGEAVEARPGDFDGQGRFAPGNSLASVGGQRRAGHTRLAARLSLGHLEADPSFRPYLSAARAFRTSQCAAIAREVGGGTCGPAASSMVASAALQLAASRFLFDLAAQGCPDLFAQASRLADASRQNLLAAHELAARVAKSKPSRADQVPWLEEADAAPTSPGSASDDLAPTADASDAIDAPERAPDIRKGAS